jgi:HK97 family phage major capsid protein
MWPITPELKKHLSEKFGLAADADDALIRKTVGEKIATGELLIDDFQKLTTVKTTEAELKVKSMIDAAVGAAINPLIAKFDAMTTPLTPAAGAGTPAATPQVPAPGTGAPAGVKAYAAGAMTGTRAGTFDDVRVKSVVEQFSDSRTAATWDKSSNPYLAKSFGGRSVSAHMDSMPYTLDMPTDRSKAIAGAWFKHMALKSMRAQGIEIPTHLKMREMDEQLVQYALHESRFVGETPAGDYEYGGEKLLSDIHRKAILDDSTSGGLEAVPIEFDASLILTPLLNGELFPLVTVRNVSRRRQEAVKVSNPTMSWGTADGTAISLFNTDSFISAFDNNIYPIVGAMEMGLDFLADSPVAIGQVVVERYGQRFLVEMDDAIASGDGTNQPEGLFTASGVTTVSSAGGAGTAPQVGDYEGLMFAVGKEYLQEAGFPPNSRAVFIGTQTAYRRARAIKVNSSSDERRIFGVSDYMSYRLADFRYAINSSIDNSDFGFFCMNRYRMYRRQGLEVQTVRGTDWTLVRQNKMGIAIRARFGGALELAGAGAKVTDGQA